jgi:putative methionine-R-sulfoxide reductase with GAF domain
MLEQLLQEIRNREMTQEALTELKRINTTLHGSLKATWTGIFGISFEKDCADAIVHEGKEKPQCHPFKLRNENNIAAMGVGDIDALIIPDVKKLEENSCKECFKNIKSAMLVPIADIRTGERIGLINAQSDKKNKFSPEELFLTQEIAFHIAPLVHQVVE